MSIKVREDMLIVPFRKNGEGAIYIKTVPKTPSITPVVNALDALFEKLNDKFFESALSKPVITLSEEGRKNAYGWFTIDKVWQDGQRGDCHEINICPEYLYRPIEDICETLLHEMVHLKNFQDGVKDYSRSGSYHNKKFQQCAEKHGLYAEQVGNYGYVKTSLKPETVNFIKSLNIEAFELFRKKAIKTRINTEDDDVSDDVGVDDADAEDEPKPSSTRKYICENCTTSIRATKEVRVRCEDCNVLFVPAQSHNALQRRSSLSEKSTAIR